MTAHLHTIKSGATGKVVFVQARTSEGTPATGLRHDAPGTRAAFVREGQGAVPFPLTAGQVGEWSPGGFAEVDPALMPGLYQLGIPNEALAEGSTRALVTLTMSNASVDPVEIELVAFDPQDSIRLGLWALGPEARLQALRGAFPILAQKEIREREALLKGRAEA
jgi:hypothetical protein